MQTGNYPLDACESKKILPAYAGRAQGTPGGSRVEAPPAPSRILSAIMVRI